MRETKIDPILFARDMVAITPPLKLTGRWRKPKDGLYRVATRRSVHGGYLVHRGRVTRCSPAVRRRIHIWATQAQYWGDPFSAEDLPMISLNVGRNSSFSPRWFFEEIKRKTSWNLSFAIRLAHLYGLALWAW
jgi:hypothetical protein